MLPLACSPILQIVTCFFRTHILQADSDEIFHAWVAALQTAISSAIHNSTLSANRKDENYSPPAHNSEPGSSVFPSKNNSQKAKYVV